MRKESILTNAFLSAVFLDNGYWNKVNRLFPICSHDQLLAAGRDSLELHFAFITHTSV